MRFRFCFVIFYCTAVLIFAVFLRNAENRIFYKLYTIKTEQGSVKQQLGNMQLRVENLINPASVMQSLEEQLVSKAEESNHLN